MSSKRFLQVSCGVLALVIAFSMGSWTSRTRASGEDKNFVSMSAIPSPERGIFPLAAITESGQVFVTALRDDEGCIVEWKPAPVCE